jgi:hypothetical protein
MARPSWTTPGERATVTATRGGDVIDLNTPTQLFLEWGWLLVTRANGIAFVLLLLVFVLGITVKLPEGKRRGKDAS